MKTCWMRSHGACAVQKVYAVETMGLDNRCLVKHVYELLMFMASRYDPPIIETWLSYHMPEVHLEITLFSPSFGLGDQCARVVGSRLLSARFLEPAPAVHPC